MAKYEITYRCGHTRTVQIYGTNVHGERERKAAWYGTRLCPECYERSKAEYIENLPTYDDGLPKLVGSPKQVKWAQDIRAHRFAEVDELLANAAEAYVKTPDATEEQIENYVNSVRKITGVFFGETSARYWIDNRDYKGGTFVSIVLKTK